jgi:hypothetical protein
MSGCIDADAPEFSEILRPQYISLTVPHFWPWYFCYTKDHFETKFLMMGAF